MGRVKEVINNGTPTGSADCRIVSTQCSRRSGGGGEGVDEGLTFVN